MISSSASFLTFLLTNWMKNIFKNNLLQRNLKTEHKFKQQKRIKEAIARHKIHLLNVCEEMNYRLCNMAYNYKKNWITVDHDYTREHYYFHSTVYKFLCLYGWINKIKKEMIYLDTTIASKEDLEFIKFLHIFPHVMCDLKILIGREADGTYAIDHFFRTKLESLPDYISTNNTPNSYQDFIKDIPNLSEKLHSVYEYFDGISPEENRKRWDRVHLLHLTIILFLNNYGYNFQKIDKKKLKEVLIEPRKSTLIWNYFNLLKEYDINNKQVNILRKIAKDNFDQSIQNTPPGPNNITCD